MDRQALIDSVEWLTADSGYGHGVCNFASSMIWGMDRPTAKNPDYKSVVFLKGPHESYTDEELELSVEFAHRHTRNYDFMYSYRRGCNAILLGKETWETGRVIWLAKRMSWISGSFHCLNLPEAMGQFDHSLTEKIADDKAQYGYRRGTVPLKHVLLAATKKSNCGARWEGTETIVEVIGKYDEFEAPNYYRWVGRTDAGEGIPFADSRMIVLADTRDKLARLLTMRADAQEAEAAYLARMENRHLFHHL